MPKISIIIPVYNAEIYLERCVNSVLMQTFQDFELILVNDGSKDNSLAICNRYSEIDQRVTVVNQSNGGVSSARNHGIEVATGNYICFVDADDYVAPEYLEQLYEDAQRDETIDLVFQGRIKKDGSIQVEVSPGIDRTFNLNEDSAFFESLSLFRYCAVYSKLFKREIIRENNIRFLTELNHGEDFDFLAKYLCHCNVVHVSSRMNYYYMINDGSISSKFNSFEHKYLGLNRIYSSLLELYHKQHEPASLGKQINDYIAYSVGGLLSLIYGLPQIGRSNRLRYLKSIDSKYVRFYGDCFIASKFSAKVLKFLFVKKFYYVYDFVCHLIWQK